MKTVFRRLRRVIGLGDAQEQAPAATLSQGTSLDVCADCGQDACGAPLCPACLRARYESWSQERPKGG